MRPVGTLDRHYLGHERISMTQDVYMARGVTGLAASEHSTHSRCRKERGKGSADLGGDGPATVGPAVLRPRQDSNLRPGD